MARLNTNAELWAYISQFGVMWDSTTGLSTTISTGGIAQGGSTLNLEASSTAATGNYIRIGPRGGTEVAKIEVGATASATLVSGVAEAHSSGEQVIELIRTNLGDISDQGINIDVTADMTTINVATQRHAYAHHVAHTDYACMVQLENLSWENLLVAMGIPEANLHGGSTVADPTVADWISDQIDTISPLQFYGVGALKDGTAVEVQFFDCDFNPNKTFNMARGQDAPLEFTFYARIIRWLNPV
jgi:hypothetical protein